MNVFPYENLSDEEFENLVIRICKEILGIGSKTFSVGKDGAKDSWFTRKARYFPSLNQPWEGTFNIQAKHTQVYNASCSDNDFSVNKTGILAREIDRLKEVKLTTPFNNYLIFTNRKLSGGTHPVIVKMLQHGIGIKNAEIIGREDIDTYLNDYPHIADQFGLYKFVSPLRFYEKELRDVIIVFSEQSKNISNVASDYIKSYDMIDKERKNELNNFTKKLDLTKDSHNLGKTTLIAVIDFMLLKQLNDDHIFKKYQDKFSGYIFYLEILLNTGEYLTIKRAIDTPTKISFKLTKVSSNLLDEKVWDHSNLPFEKAETILNEYLSFDVLKRWNYRKSVTYFLRSQKDYNDVFQLSKFTKGKDVDWKPFMFDLLGFDGNLLTEKYDTDGKISEQKTFINSLKNKFAVDTEEVDKIKGAIDLKRAEQKELQEQIDNFNFYQQERKLNKELVEDVERQIAELNSIEYNTEFDLDKL